MFFGRIRQTAILGTGGTFKMWKPARVTIIGGSTASGHSVEQAKTFGCLVAEQLGVPFQFYTSDLAKIADLNEIVKNREISEDDLVLILAGIGDSWPQPQGIFAKILPPSWRGAGKMNPAARKSRSLVKRIRQRIRHFMKFTIKMFFWILGFYRPDTSKSDFAREVRSIAETLNTVNCRTVWMFPQKPRIFSTFIELNTVRKYVGLITTELARTHNPRIFPFDINTVIDDQADILGDGLHLAESGHAKVAIEIVRLFNESVSTS